MLSSEINYHSLLDSWAEHTLFHISQSTILPDKAMLIAARLLLVDRLDNSERFSIGSWPNSNCTSSTIRDAFVSDDEENILFIINMQRHGTITLNFEIPEGWIEQPDINHKIEDFLTCRVFINPTIKRSIIITNKMSVETFHYFCGLFRRLAPWYFEEKPLTDEEKAYLASFFYDDRPGGPHYSETINILYALKQKCFNKMRTEYLLNGFTKNIHEAQMTKIKDQNESIKRNIDRYFDEISSLNQQIQDNNLRLIAYRNMNDKEDHILEFITNNDNIIVTGANNGNATFRFEVNTYFEEYDEDVFESMLEDKKSLFYLDGEGQEYVGINEHFIDDDNKKLFMTALYSKTFRMRMKAGYKFNLKESSVCALDRYSLDTVDDTRMINPHIGYFSCLGGYQSAIVRYLMDGDIPGAITTCQLSAASVNLQETPTMTRFMQDIYGRHSEEKIYEDKDGKLYTALEVLDILQGGNK